MYKVNQYKLAIFIHFNGSSLDWFEINSLLAILQLKANEKSGIVFGFDLRHFSDAD